jgi:hypothetical protein
MLAKILGWMGYQKVTQSTAQVSPVAQQQVVNGITIIEPNHEEDPPPLAIPLTMPKLQKAPEDELRLRLFSFKRGRFSQTKLAEWLRECGDSRADAVARMGRFDPWEKKELSGRKLDLAELKEAISEDNMNLILSMFPEVYHAPSGQWNVPSPGQPGKRMLSPNIGR